MPTLAKVTPRERYFEGVFEESQKVNPWNAKMFFAGIKKKKDERADIIAYLKKTTNE